jgi:hypothetical protein
MQEEIWKDIPNYEGLYKVSNLGRIKSLNYRNTGLEGILKPRICSNKYQEVNLYKHGKAKSRLVHQLVAIVFLNHVPCGKKLVVDHINDNKHDNIVNNLQIVTHRYNICKTQGRYSSKYKGVAWCKQRKKWIVRIDILNKTKYLGHFTDEYEGHLVYQKALSELKTKIPL